MKCHSPKLDGGDEKKSVLISEDDWLFMKVLVRSGMVSIQKNNKLLFQSMLSHRVDILSEILRFCNDLTEQQAVSILNYLFSVSYIVVNGYVRVGRTVFHWNDQVESTLSLVVTQDSEKLSLKSALKEEEERKPKKKSRSNDKTDDKADNNSIARSAVRDSVVAIKSHLDLIRMFMELFFARNIFYSSTLISESISKFLPDLSSVCLLIRLSTLMLKEFFHFKSEEKLLDNEESSKKRKRSSFSLSVTSSGKYYFFSSFSDHQLTNLIVFLEGMLDGCFLPLIFAIHPSSSSSSSTLSSEIIKCLSSLIQTIKSAEESDSYLQKLSTVSAIFHRTASNHHLVQNAQKDLITAQKEIEVKEGISTDKVLSVSSSVFHELHRKPLLDYYSVEKITI
jgi:hypothetical protein